jgi:hypothetical protein
MGAKRPEYSRPEHGRKQMTNVDGGRMTGKREVTPLEKDAFT